MSDTYEFELKSPLKFANTKIGAEDETFSIFMRAPTYREMDQAIKMEQHLYKCFANVQAQRAGKERAEKPNTDDDDQMSASEIIAFLGMYGDLDQALKDFEKLAMKVCAVSDNIDLKEKHYRSLPISEIKRMCGEYMSFFIAPSVISEMMAGISDD